MKKFFFKKKTSKMVWCKFNPPYPIVHFPPYFVVGTLAMGNIGVFKAPNL